MEEPTFSPTRCRPFRKVAEYEKIVAAIKEYVARSMQMPNWCEVAAPANESACCVSASCHTSAFFLTSDRSNLMATCCFFVNSAAMHTEEFLKHV